MPPFDPDVFQTAAAKTALKKYAAVTHLSIRLYDRDRRVIAEETGSNRLFSVFSAAREPNIVLECVACCFAQSHRPPCSASNTNMA
jgi:hypothetical protein